MTQNDAVSILIQGVRKAYDNHIYTLEEAGVIFLAIQTFSPPTEQPHPPSENKEESKD